MWNRLVSLNEVGGAPDRYGVSIHTFHRLNAERLERWPHSLLTTSTHDTKRSEDVRARLNALSELPGDWQSAVTRWGRARTLRKCSRRGPAGARSQRRVSALPDADRRLAAPWIA